MRLYRILLSLSVTGMLFFNGCGGGKSRSETENRGKLRQQPSITQTVTAQDLRNASLKGEIQIVRQAVGQGVDVNAADEAGRTALMLASYNGHTEVTELLLEKGANIDAQNADGRTPLIFAASGPFPETVDLLLKAGADPNATDQVEGWSPLMFAAAGGHKEVVQTLLNHNANSSLKDKDGETAIDFAKNNNHTEIVNLLKNSK